MVGAHWLAVAVSRALDVQVSGAGTVKYRGDPDVKQQISGSGRIVEQ